MKIIISLFVLFLAGCAGVPVEIQLHRWDQPVEFNEANQPQHPPGLYVPVVMITVYRF